MREARPDQGLTAECNDVARSQKGLRLGHGAPLTSVSSLPQRENKERVLIMKGGDLRYQCRRLLIPRQNNFLENPSKS
jgi:hypothetical protein